MYSESDVQSGVSLFQLFGKFVHLEESLTSSIVVIGKTDNNTNISTTIDSNLLQRFHILFKLSQGQPLRHNRIPHKAKRPPQCFPLPNWRLELKFPELYNRSIEHMRCRLDRD